MGWTDLSPEQHEQLNPSNGWASLTPEQHQALASNPKDISIPESFARGAVNQFGIAPAVVGAEESYPEALGVLLGKNSIQDVKDAYNKHREESLSNFNAAEKAHPVASFAGNLAGGLVPAYLTGGASELAEGAQALSTGQKALAGASAGGLYGAASGLGNSISQGNDTQQALHNTVKGGLVGAATGGVLGGLMGAIGNNLNPDALDEFANKRAVKATGLNASQMKVLKGQGRVDEIGDTLLNNNIITPLSNPETVLANSEQAIDSSGQKLGSILKGLDETYSADNSDFVSPNKIYSEIKTQLLEPVEGEPIAESQENLINKVLATVAKRGDEPITFQDAQKLKNVLTSQANYNSQDPSAVLLKRAVGIINDNIEESADKVAQASENPQLYSDFLDTKKLYGAASEAYKASLGKSSRQAVNRDFGLTDYILGGTGAMLHGGVGAAAAMGLNKFGKMYGNSLLATGAKSASNGISAVLEGGAAGLSALKDKVASQGELGQKVANVLDAAAQKDDIGRNALIFTLMQNPGYRELINKNLNQKQE